MWFRETRFETNFRRKDKKCETKKSRGRSGAHVTTIFFFLLWLLLLRITISVEGGSGSRNWKGRRLSSVVGQKGLSQKGFIPQKFWLQTQPILAELGSKFVL